VEEERQENIVKKIQDVRGKLEEKDLSVEKVEIVEQEDFTDIIYLEKEEEQEDTDIKKIEIY
jgi:hypothetical protein